MTAPGGTDSHAPSDWHESRLGDLARIRRGASPRPIDNPRWFAENGPGWVRISDVTKAAGRLRSTEQYLSQDGVERSVRVGMGDVIMSICATIGEPVVVEMDACIHDGFVVFDQFENSLDRQFLLHLLRKTAPEFKASGQTGTQANLNTGIVNGKTVRIPRSAAEQARIAAVLDTVDEAIAKTEAVIAKLKQVRAGLLHDLLTRGLDLSACDAQAGEHGQLRDPIAHPEQFQDSPMGRIPREWRVVQLGEVADIASGVTLGRKLDGGGTLELSYLRVANVQDGYLDLADVKTVRIFPDELDRFRLRHGDVLMNEGGDYDKLGRGTVWEDQIPICLHQNHVFRVRCRPDVLNCYFLAAVSGSETGKRYFLGSSKQSTNLASINSTQLNAFEIPVPSLVEQEAIIKILKVQDDQLTTEARGLVKLHALKSGLMTDLLTGRVRVPEHFGVRRHDAALSSRAHEPASGPLGSEIADESGDASPHSKDTSSRSKGEAP